MPGLIITADDYGLSDDVNLAITEALVRRLVTHASLMANMPAFEAACTLASEHGLLDRLGVHLVLTEGEPLTATIRSCARFCDADGRFTYWRSHDRALRLSRPERTAVTKELRAQILRCLERGVEITHLDSHHHVHNKFAIGGIVIALASEFGVPRVRLAHNCGPRIGTANRVYKGVINMRLRRAGLAQTRRFGSPADYLRLVAAGASTLTSEGFEINTHPAMRNGALVDLGRALRPLDHLLS